MSEEGKVDDEKRYMTQKEVAALFRVSQSTIKSWRDQGKIEYFQPEGSSRVLYPADAVAEFERRCRRKARTPEARRPVEIKRERPGVSARPEKVWRI